MLKCSCEAPAKKHLKTLEAIQRHPVPANIKYQDFEAMIIAMGYERHLDGGSQVTFTKGARQYMYHRPHPRKDVDKGALADFNRHYQEFEA